MRLNKVTNMVHKKYTNEDVIQAVASSTSIRQVLTKLNLKEAGGNYATIKKLIKELSLDISHLTGKGWSKDRKFGPKRPIESYLSNENSIISHKLRLRLINENIFEHKCYSCNNTTWLDNPIPLELEHINGDRLDNTLNNLTLLCPNCHALTETYRGKNIQKDWCN